MKTKLTQSVLMLFLVVGLFSVGAGEAEGKSVSWSSGIVVDTLAYLGNCGGSCGGYVGWVNGLKDFNVNINYQASAYRNSGEINDNSTISVGDTISFAAPITATDISWNGVGRSTDTPYGHWVSGATAPSVDYSADFVNSYTLLTATYNVYIPLAVNPSNMAYTYVGSTAGLDCNSDNVADVNPVGQSCKVMSAGMIRMQVNYSDTYGKFYYHYTGAYTYYTGIAMRKSWIPAGGVEACGPMPLTSCNILLSSSDYILTVPAQTITFNLTAVSNNNRPLPPSLTVDAPSKNVNTDFVFTATSTDPDGDTLKYGFDWNNDTIIDQWVPASLFVASGTPQTANYQWPTAGTYTVRAVAMDSNGGQSDPSAPLSVTVNALPPNPIINSFTINGSTGSVNLLRGDMRNIAWNVSNAVSCTASSGDIWSGNKSVPTGNDALPANVTTPHTLDCMNVLGTHTSSTIQVNVSCTPSTGTFGSCACATETKTRTNTSALCIAVIESTNCDVDEKKACRNFNWTEGTP